MDGERPIVDQNPEALSFVEKYNTTGCNKVKAEMRDLWKEAHEDFEFAGAILKARKNAFQETVTEGVWMSHEQLADEMKNEQHALKTSTSNKNVPKTQAARKARAKRLAVLKQFKMPPTPHETSSSSSS